MYTIKHLNPEILAGFSKAISNPFASWILEKKHDESIYSITESIEMVSLFKKEDKTRVASNKKWHIQIRQDNKACFFARITQGNIKERNYTNFECFKSKKALAIEESLRWLEHNESRETCYVRLLEIPSFFIVAFTLESLNSLNILIVDSPAFPSFELKKIYTISDFEHLISTHKKIKGIINDSD